MPLLATWGCSLCFHAEALLLNGHPFESLNEVEDKHKESVRKFTALVTNNRLFQFIKKAA